MTITSTEITSDEQWKELRNPNIGASEIGTLFGAHPNLTPYRLSALKLGLLEPEPDNPMMRRGRLLEPVALKLLAEERPDWEVWNPRAYFCDDEARLGATPDCFVRDPQGRLGTVQIKSVEPNVFNKKWKDEDDNIVVPEWIRLQCALEQFLCGAEFAYVAVLVVGHGIELHLIEVTTDHETIVRIYDRAAVFWEIVNDGRTLDPDFDRDAATLAAVHRKDNGKELDMSDDNWLPTIASRLQTANETKAAAEELASHCRAQILHLIGDAQKVKFAGGTISAPTVKRKEHTVKAGSFRTVTVRMARNGGGEMLT